MKPATALVAARPPGPFLFWNVLNAFFFAHKRKQKYIYPPLILWCHFNRLWRRNCFIFFPKLPTGQQVVEEILDAQGAACPPEYINIKIPENHEYRTKGPNVPELPVLRTRYDMRTGFSPNNPRQQVIKLL